MECSALDRRRLLGQVLAAASMTVIGPSALGRAQWLSLPSPRSEGQMSVERAMGRRRSVRSFDGAPLSLGQLSQLLWAAQGVTGSPGRRTAPSAGGLYPLTICLAAGSVTGLASGAYQYEPGGHRLLAIGNEDLRARLAAAARQGWIAQAPVVLAIFADPGRPAAKYGTRGARFVQIEAGAAAQNVQLQAVSLGLGSTDVGAFDEARVRALFRRPPREEPLLLMPVGRPA